MKLESGRPRLKPWVHTPYGKRTHRIKVVWPIGREGIGRGVSRSLELRHSFNGVVPLDWPHPQEDAKGQTWRSATPAVAQTEERTWS